MKLNTESFKEKVRNVVGDEYEVLGEYVDYNYTKVRMKHNICGYEYEILPSSFIRGSRCAKCQGLLKSTTKEYRLKVESLVGDEYTVLGEYRNSKTPIKMKHNVCGYVYEVRPNSFLNGNRCPNCRTNKRYDEERFVNKINELVGDEYTVIGQFINTSTKVEMRHNQCGHQYFVAPSTFFSGHRCPNCYKSVSHSKDDFIRMAKEAMGSNYRILNGYTNMNTKIKVQHTICGYEYEVLPANFLRGNGCPKCSRNLKRSLPEEIVSFFIKQHFEIIQGFRPDWLTFESGQKGEIDIWIPSLQVGIEYDGNFHCNVRKKSNDKIKNDIIENSNYCKMLIRICESKVEYLEQQYKKIKYIHAQNSIAITSLRGVDELERLIKQCLAFLEVSDKQLRITREIIELCRNNIEKYYADCGKPMRTSNMKTRKSNTDEYKARVMELCGDEYSVIGEYTYALDNILMKHNKCGYEYYVRPNSFLTGRRCPYCANRIKITTESYSQSLQDLVGDEFICMSKYKGSKKKILIKHSNCQMAFEVYPLRFLKKVKCPLCSQKK